MSKHTICPISKCKNISNLSNPQTNDLLYSIYNSYQNTSTPKYIADNLMYLTNPLNYKNVSPGPSNIFIIRHGEKNSNNELNNEYYYTLNCNGIDRACKLPDFINQLADDGTPIFSIITCQPNMNSITDNNDNSMRPETTIMLSSFLLNIPLYIYSGSNVSQPYDGETAFQLFTNPIFRGKNVLIVWEHKNIQSLTNQIIQCYEYLSSGKTVEDLVLNKKQVFENQNTFNWWSSNTPIPPQNKYVSSFIPQYPLPYISYSQLLPYWNTNNFNHVYKLTQSNGNLIFNIGREDIITSYKNCELIIGLLQYEGESKYEGETNCIPPS